MCVFVRKIEVVVHVNLWDFKRIKKNLQILHMHDHCYKFGMLEDG